MSILLDAWDLDVDIFFLFTKHLNHEQRQNQETDSGLLRCYGSVSAIRQIPFSYHSQHISGAKCTCPPSNQAQSPGADSRAGRMAQGKESVPGPRRWMGAPRLLTQLDPPSTGAGPAQPSRPVPSQSFPLICCDFSGGLGKACEASS